LLSGLRYLVVDNLRICHTVDQWTRCSGAGGVVLRGFNIPHPATLLPCWTRRTVTLSTGSLSPTLLHYNF